VECSSKHHHDDGAGVMLKGSSEFVSMYSQKGSKGVNQDSLTVRKVRFFMFMFAVWLHFLFSFPSILLELFSLEPHKVGNYILEGEIIDIKLTYDAFQSLSSPRVVPLLNHVFF